MVVVKEVVVEEEVAVGEEAVEDQEACQWHHHFHQMPWFRYPPQLI
jgi:hypothetical protein